LNLFGSTEREPGFQVLQPAALSISGGSFLRPAIGTFSEFSVFLVGTVVWRNNMPNPTFRRWTADDIAKLKNLAQRHPRAEIAAKLGRSVAATTLKAHELKLSLRMRDPGDEVQRGRRAAGMDLSGPNE
jgi:hypothetical protein